MASLSHKTLRPGAPVRAFLFVFALFALVALFFPLALTRPLTSLLAVPLVTMVFGWMRGAGSSGVRVGATVELRGLSGAWRAPREEIVLVWLCPNPAEVVVFTSDSAGVLPLAGRSFRGQRGEALLGAAAQEFAAESGLEVVVVHADEPLPAGLAQVRSVAAFSRANLLAAVEGWPIYAGVVFCGFTALLASIQ